MVIGIFGESCAGKSFLAAKLKEALSATVYTGKDYLRLAGSESAAKTAFSALLQQAVRGESVIYVISEREHLALLPPGAIRILVTAELSTICDRFAARMHGTLPPPVKAMLERKHGCFDLEPCDLHVKSETCDPDAVLAQILALAK